VLKLSIRKHYIHLIQTTFAEHSLQKTNKLLVVDEDVPGAASAYILQKIVEGKMVITALMPAKNP
jgi:hypothetical protein